MDEGPAVEVAQPLSRDGTPTEEEHSIESHAKQEDPDASATPPPPEEPSSGPTTEFEPVDMYFDPGNGKYSISCRCCCCSSLFLSLKNQVTPGSETV